MRNQLIRCTPTPGYTTAAYGAPEVGYKYESTRTGSFTLLYDPTGILRPGAEFYSSLLSPTFKDNGDGFAHEDGTLLKREVDGQERVFVLYTARSPYYSNNYQQWLVEVPERDTGQALIEYQHTKNGASMSRIDLPPVTTQPRIAMFSLVDLRALVTLARAIMQARREPTPREERRLKRFVGDVGDNLLAYHSKLDYFVQCCVGL